MSAGEVVSRDYAHFRQEARTMAIARNKLLEQATQSYLRYGVYLCVCPCVCASLRMNWVQGCEAIGARAVSRGSRTQQEHEGSARQGALLTS